MGKGAAVTSFNFDPWRFLGKSCFALACLWAISWSINNQEIGLALVISGALSIWAWEQW